LRDRGPLLLRRDEAVLAHPLQDVALAGNRLLWSALRLVAARRLRQPSEQRGLGDGEVLDPAVAELPRRRRDAVGAGAEVDVVQVEVEDVVLRQLRLEPQG